MLRLSAHLLFSLGVVDVADGDGEGVGGVSWLGCYVKFEQAGDHELNLLLGGEAIPDDGTLDGERSVFRDGEAAIRRGQHGNAADLAELECAFGIGGEEDFFYGNNLGLPELEEGGEFGIDLKEADGGAVLLVELDGSGAEVAELGVTGGRVDLDYAVACEFCSAIDTEDPHEYESNATKPLTTTWPQPGI